MRQPKCGPLATLGFWLKMTCTSSSRLRSADSRARANAVLLPEPRPPARRSRSTACGSLAKPESATTSSRPPCPPAAMAGRPGRRADLAVGLHEAQAPGLLGHQEAAVRQESHRPRVLQPGRDRSGARLRRRPQPATRQKAESAPAPAHRMSSRNGAMASAFSRIAISASSMTLALHLLNSLCSITMTVTFNQNSSALTSFATTTCDLRISIRMKLTLAVVPILRGMRFPSYLPRLLLASTPTPHRLDGRTRTRCSTAG